jgi:hypothetical protein
VESPRPVRIAKTPGPARVVRVAATPAPAPPPAVPAEVPTGSAHRDNAPAVARAWRIVAIYLVALAALYAGFLALELRGPGAGGSLANQGLLVFTGIAAALAVGGFVVTMAPVPRSVEVSPTAVVVVEWAGRRREFPPLSDLRVDVVRRYAPSVLTGIAVEAVELTGGRRRRTYQLVPGLLPEHRPRPVDATPS